MDTKKLRQKILDLAIRGKLVPQDPYDEPASVLLERIRAEKERLVKEGKIKKSKASKTSDTPHYEQVPFEVPSSWVWTTLGDIGTWQSGGTPSRANKSYYGGNIPWLKTGDLNDGLITDIPESITEEAVENSSAKINPSGSVLIAMYGATIGKLGILTFPSTTNQACCACIEYNGVTQLYLFYYLLSQREQFIAKGGGGAQPNISKEIIVNTLIPIPPLKEQHAIVDRIKQYFALIDRIESGKNDLKTIIKQTKDKILDLAIHGGLVPQDPNDEPASELLKRINPKAEITCDNGQYGKLPDGWGLIMISKVVELLSGRDLTSNDCNEDEEGVPYLIGASNIVNNHLNITRWTKNPQVISSIGDILISCKGTIGEIVLNDIGNIHIARQFMAIRPNKNSIITEYFQYYLLAMVHNIKDNARGVIPGISREDILTKYFPLPPLAEQQRIVDAIDKAFAKLDAIMESL